MKNPAVERRGRGVDDGVLEAPKKAGGGYFSLALTEIPTMRGSL